MNVHRLVKKYFEMELCYKDIVEILFLNHGVSISLRQIKRYLSHMGLTRRKYYSNLQSVFDFVDEQIATRGQIHGYRWMHQQAKLHGFKVKREHIRLMLNTIDPEGVNIRLSCRLKRREYSARGSNFCWHFDSYDKLKKYGLCINGCIDGFSRKVIWLKVGKTSSNPKVIAIYFVEAVREHGGHPYCMRGDMGTENGLVAAIQTHFFGDEAHILSPFIYGKSTMNTRIESWWGKLRKKCCEIWIEELKDLKDRGQFTGNKLDVNLVQFCFMELLQNELNETVIVWNTHQIRCSREGDFHGRPVNMYLFPGLFNVQDYIRPVDAEILELCKSECADEDIYPCEEEVFELGCIYMEENMLDQPTYIYQAKALYLFFRHWLIEQL